MNAAIRRSITAYIRKQVKRNDVNWPGAPFSHSFFKVTDAEQMTTLRAMLAEGSVRTVDKTKKGVDGSDVTITYICLP